MFDFMSKHFNKYIFGKLKETWQRKILFSVWWKEHPMYKRIWKPEGEKLMCYYEDCKPYDMFSIQVCKPGEDCQIVGHLPMEINSATHFIL